MTIGRTSKGKARRMGKMENMGHRINLERRDLLILDISLETSREDQCMRCGKHEHHPGQMCPAKNAKCKECHKIGHFYKVCQSKKRATQQVQLDQTPQEEDDTNTDELGARQPNPLRVNMLKVVNHIDANGGSFNEEKTPQVSHSESP